MSSMLEILTMHVLITCILMSIIALVGLLGNVLMIRAWIKYRKLRTDFYTVFTGLAIFDIIFLVVNVPVEIMDQLLVNEVTTTWCNASNYIINVCGFIAAYLIVVLSVLRGILLTNRNTVSRPQAKHLIIVCIIVTIITSVSSISILSMYFELDGVCRLVVGTNHKRETWLMNAFASLVPLFLVLIIYTMTYLLGKRFFADSYSPREREKSRLVTCIIIAFIVCQLPYRVAAIVQVYDLITDFEMYQKFFTIKGYLMCWLMADKAIRPVLYSKLASDLSVAFDEVVNCKVCSKTYTMSPTLQPRRRHHVTTTTMSSDNGGLEGAPTVSGMATPYLDRSSSDVQFVNINENDSNDNDDDDDVGIVMRSSSSPPFPSRSESTSSATSTTPLTRKDDLDEICFEAV